MGSSAPHLLGRRCTAGGPFGTATFRGPAGPPLRSPPVTVADAELTATALADLHRARRRNHRQNIHWVDALYRVYLTGIGALVATLVLAGQFPQTKLDATGQATLVDQGPAWLGAVFVAVLVTGLRSGARGGPLTLEAAVVQHELLAPVDRRATLRQPALHQVRSLGFAGLLVGAIVGLLAARQTSVEPALSIAACALTFGAAAVTGAAAALVMSGHRLGIRLADTLAVLLLAWSAADVHFHLVTSPASMLASVAFWPLRSNPLGILALAMATATIMIGVGSVGNLSLEQARRRAGLVSQLRFAVTLQDVRTVVLLRRQLAQELPRSRPYLQLRRGRGRLPAVWRRDWQSYLRFPPVRIARMVALAVVAGFAVGFTWQGTVPAFLVGALALYLAAYDAVEPLAQEIDHPSRWDAIPEPQGRILLQHLPAAALIMVLLVVVSAATALVLVPVNVVMALAPMFVLPVAVGATVGAAVSTSMGAPNQARQLDELGADMLGFVQMIRLVLPPAMVVAAMLPMLAAGHDAGNLQTQRVSNSFFWPLIVIGGGLLYLTSRRPSRL